MQSLQDTFLYGLPKGAKLFSADAVSMYSNIHTGHGLEVIETFINLHLANLPANFPKQMLLESLTKIMENNIFQFGDTYWWQKSGTAMGTSTAVNYAVLYVSLLEITKLLPKYPHNLQYLKCFIDNIIGVWTPSALHPESTFENFMEDLNDFGTLHWTCEDGLVDELQFLDMRVSIDSK